MNNSMAKKGTDNRGIEEVTNQHGGIQEWNKAKKSKDYVQKSDSKDRAVL